MDREHPPDDNDLDRTAVRPLADDLLDRPPPAPDPPSYADDDLLADEEFMAPGGPKPSRVTRILLALLVCGVGILIGVQLGLAHGSAAGAAGAGAGAGQSRRFGPPGAGATGTESAAPRSTLGSTAPATEGEVSSVKDHTLALNNQGVTQTVTFTDDTTVTKPYGHGSLAVGDAVTVFGSRAADGSVNATSIVVR